MSNENDELDDVTVSGESTTMKDLRKQLDAAKKRADEAEKRAADADARDRAVNVSKLLESKGVKPGLAKFYSGDSSEEAVNSWIEENAELLGIEPPDDDVDEATRSAAARIAQATSTAQGRRTGSPEDVLAAINSAKTREELDAAYALAGLAVS